MLFQQRNHEARYNVVIKIASSDFCGKRHAGFANGSCRSEVPDGAATVTAMPHAETFGQVPAIRLRRDAKLAASRVCKFQDAQPDWVRFENR